MVACHLRLEVAERIGPRGEVWEPLNDTTVRIAAAQPKNRTLDFRLKPADVLAQVEKSLDELEKLVAKGGAAGCDALAFPEQLEYRLADRTAVKEVLDAAFIPDEPEALIDEEPCNCPRWHAEASAPAL